MRNEPTLTDAEALAAVNAVRAQMQADGKPAAVAVVDSHGELLAFLRADGAKRGPIQIAINKAYTAVRERCPTVQIGRSVRDPQRGFDIAYYGDPRVVGWGGGIPIVHDGQVLGAVGVSGLSEEEDMRLAAIGVATIDELLRRDARPRNSHPVSPG
jgi:glc operon protein GlcG